LEAPFNVQSWIPLTLLSDVTHNPAARESEASVIFCCLRLVRRKAVPKHAMPTQYFFGLDRFSIARME
jgi:hypothetical protein